MLGPSLPTPCSVPNLIQRTTCLSPTSCWNFLATAYAITEHFKVSYRKRFKKNSAKIKEYEDFLDRLCAGSWATAFFFDFRNYVQHNGLPVGRYNKVSNLTKVEITIEQDAVELLNDYKDWKRSKLDGAEENWT